jgi:signal transduction histidine kinase/CheY-like chemotaxis protein
MRGGLLAVCGFWMLFLAWGSLERRRSGSHTTYVAIGALSWWLSLSGMAYAMGPITSPAWAVVLIGIVSNLLLFPTTLALVCISVGIMLIVASLALVAAGLIPYAPMLAEQPIAGSQVAISYLVGNTLGSVLGTLLILGVVLYIMAQWKNALAHLEQLNVDLERMVEERTDELVRAEQQLREVQKMEAVGRLAGGIAHDFNNLLAIIAGYSDELLSAQEIGNPVKQDVAEIKTAATRAARLVEQLLAVGRRQITQSQPVQLNDVVEETAELLQPLVGEHVELVLQLDPGLGIAEADAGQMQQVLLNLATNARDAMPAGGRLTIETANFNVAVPTVVGAITVPPGSYVTLSVTDTGCGMDPELQVRAFEPFVTTKEHGRGTGLGLASVYGMVVQSCGLLSLESRLGEGSTFCVYLPRVAALAKPVAPRPATRAAPVRSATMLIAEDDSALRRMLCRRLEAQGHAVLAAADGVEALELAQHHPTAIDLLVTDVVMPRMDGAALARKFAEVHPEARVVFMTAYADEVFGLKDVLARNEQILRKPFSQDALETAVRSALEAPTG